MSSDLVIPDAAREEWFHCGCEAGCDRAGFQADALPIVVAAELRRIADGMTLVLSDDPRPFDAGYKQRGDEIADWFHRRADELDPPARQED